MLHNQDNQFSLVWYDSNDDGLERFIMTPINSDDREPIPLEKIREDLIKQMKDMDEKEIENIANIIVGLVKELRELKSNEK